MASEGSTDAQGRTASDSKPIPFVAGEVVFANNPEFYCGSCKIQCGSEQGFKSHCNGAVHLRNAGNGLNLTAGMKQVTGQAPQNTATEPKEPICDEYYCQVCSIRCSGIKPYEAHISGARHKRNEQSSSFSFGTPRSAPPRLMKNVRKILKIRQTLNNSREHLLGLQHLIEVQKDNPEIEPRYLCNLCDAKCDPRTVISHFVGVKHRTAYIRANYPEYCEMIKTDGGKKSELSAAVEKVSQLVEEAEGRNEPTVNVEPDPYYNQSLKRLNYQQEGPASKMMRGGAGRGRFSQSEGLGRGQDRGRGGGRGHDRGRGGGQDRGRGRGQDRGRGQGQDRGRSGGRGQDRGRGGERGRGGDRGLGGGRSQDRGRGRGQSRDTDSWNLPDYSGYYGSSDYMDDYDSYSDRYRTMYSSDRFSRLASSSAKPARLDYMDYSQDDPLPSSFYHAGRALMGKAGSMLEFLRHLEASCVVTNEEEAGLALKVSNALTQALLDYRLRSVPNEVMNKLGSIGKPKPEPATAVPRNYSEDSSRMESLYTAFSNDISNMAGGSGTFGDSGGSGIFAGSSESQSGFAGSASYRNGSSFGRETDGASSGYMGGATGGYYG